MESWVILSDGRMPLRQTLQWMLVLLATFVIVAGGGIIWLWVKSDQLLKSQITQSLSRLAPELPIDFERVSLETDGRVRMTEMRLLTPDHGGTLIRLPELVTYLDRDLFVQHRQISIQRVLVNHPQVTLDQAADGSWSFEGMKFPKPVGMAWPAVEILDGDILLRAHRDALLPIELRLTNLDATLKPTARGQCHIEGNGDVDPLGPVEIRGDLDTTTGRWKLAIQARRIPAGDGLIGVAAGLSPHVRTKIQNVAQVIQDKTRGAVAPSETPEGEIQVASLDAPEQPQDVPQTVIPKIGLRADLFAQCEVSCEGTGEPIDYSVDLRIEHGEVTDLFPIQLHDVSGRLLMTRTRLTIENLKASNSQSQLIVDGTLPLGGDAEPPNLTLKASNLPIDRSIREKLTGSILKLYDQIQPEGRFDIDLKYSPEVSPPVVLKEFRVRDGSMMHDLFRYRVNSITGTIVQEGDRYVFNMKGLASGHEGFLTGYVRNPGPHLEADLRVRSKGLPIDETLIAAFETPKLKAVAAAIRQLRIRGEGDVDVSFRKHPDLGAKFKTFLTANVQKSELNYVRFPVPLTQVSGRIEHDPTQGNIWHFKNLRGSRGETLVTGSGRYIVRDGGGDLDLLMNAQDVPIDATLKAACLTATDRLQEVWNQLNPSAGRLKCERLSIHWSPGEHPLIRMPVVQFDGAALRLKAVPYPLDRVKGELSWDGQTAEIRQAEGWHGSTFVEIPSSEGDGTSFFQLTPAAGIDWRLHLPQIVCRKILADEELRAALPDSIRTAVAQLDPRGPLDLDLALDLKQFRAPEATVTASFTVDTTLQGNQLTTGINLDDATGQVSIIKGTWDGQTVSAEGYATLDSVRIWNLPLTNLEGPFSIVGNRITAGKPSAGNPSPYSEDNPFARREVVASLYDGKVSLNAETLIDPRSSLNTKYDAEINVRDARLELWAREQGSRQRLNGPVNGYLSFHGRGPSPMEVEGTGWVQITQAQLYELPVLIKIFTMPDFRSPDDKAFKYAYADFRLHQGLFDFTKIQLVGDAISLVGRGYVGFAGERDRQIDFDFYTDARNKVPLIEPIIRRVASRWVWIRVDGTLDMPTAVMQTRVPILDDVFQGLIKGIENGQFQTPPNPPLTNAPRRPPR